MEKLENVKNVEIEGENIAIPQKPVEESVFEEEVVPVEDIEDKKDSVEEVVLTEVLEEGENLKVGVEEVPVVSLESEELIIEKKTQEEFSNMDDSQKETVGNIMAAFEQKDESLKQETENLSEKKKSLVRKTGEWYKKVPTKYKLLLSAGLLATAAGGAVVGGAAASVAMTAAFAGSIGQRMFGAASTFILVEDALRKNIKEGDSPEEIKKKERKAKMYGVLAGSLVASGVFGKVIGAAVHEVGGAGANFLAEHYPGALASLQGVGHNIQEGIHDTFTIPEAHAGTLPTATSSPEMIGHAATSSVSHIETAGHTAEPAVLQVGSIHLPEKEITFVAGHGTGESGHVWGGIAKSLDDRHLMEGFDEQKRNEVINAIKNKVATMSPEELHAIGISSGNPDLIYPGEHIDLTKVIEAKQDLFSHSLSQVHETVKPLADLSFDQSSHIASSTNEAIFNNSFSTPTTTPPIILHPEVSATPSAYETFANSAVDKVTVDATPERVLGEQLANLTVEQANEALTELPTAEKIKRFLEKLSSLEFSDAIKEKVQILKDPSFMNDWTDAEKGISTRNAKEFYDLGRKSLSDRELQSDSFKEGGVGVDSKDAVVAVQSVMQELMARTTDRPKEDESVYDFLDRCL
jgi:hypothetical protein